MEQIGVCVVCDSYNKIGQDYILELLTLGSRLAAQLGCKMALLYIGKQKELPIDPDIFYTYGADIIYNYEKRGNEALYEVTDVVEDMLFQLVGVKTVLFPCTLEGEFISACISSRHEIGLTADCIDVFLNNGQIVYARTALNASVIANIVTKNCPFGMCTVKKNIIYAEKRKWQGSVELVPFANPVIKQRSLKAPILLAEQKRKLPALDFSDSRLVFGAGRGIMQSDSMKLFLSAADKLGAAVVCTRTLVELGIMEEVRQVGQSGRSIKPDIYIAFGISGSNQHMIGVRKAKTIIAINSDPNAPIFNYSHYNIVADAVSILRVLTE